MPDYLHEGLDHCEGLRGAVDAALHWVVHAWREQYPDSDPTTWRQETR